MTCNNANRFGTSQHIASGAVAGITVSPVHAEHAYNIRFNHGAEIMLRHDEFSVLKAFKDEGIDAIAPRLSLEDWQPFTFYRRVFSSQALGLSRNGSDVDCFGIYLPPAELHRSLYSVPEQIANNSKPTRNSKHSS